VSDGGDWVRGVSEDEEGVLAGKLRIGLTLLAALTALSAISTASAAPPTAVTITSDTSFESPTSTFDATGGVICGTGTVSNVFTLFVGFQSNTHAQILVLKRFVCPDGTFDILLRVSLNFADLSTKGTWSVLDGTGAYAKLHGAGTITGENRGTSVFDTYTGKMHID
jgi:hypothetical protein